MAVLISQSDEAKALMKERGWDAGWVLFGAGASEATVKLFTAVSLLGKPYKHVDLSFDDVALSAEDKMGVKSKEWALLSASRSNMPALSIDGQVYFESDGILMKLAEDANAPAEVKELIALSSANNGRLLEAAKHWGWSGLHKGMRYGMVTESHYSSFGEGLKDSAWEAATCGVVHSFFARLESVLAAKPAVNGFFVGDSMTLADCALINWYLTFSAIANLDVDGRYPKVAANWAALKATNPAGASYHYEHFPGFGGYVAGAMKEARANGFDINKSMPPNGPEDGRSYLARHQVEETLRNAVTTLLRERPNDPLKALGDLLLAKAK